MRKVRPAPTMKRENDQASSCFLRAARAVSRPSAELWDDHAFGAGHDNGVHGEMQARAGTVRLEGVGAGDGGGRRGGDGLDGELLVRLEGDNLVLGFEGAAHDAHLNLVAGADGEGGVHDDVGDRWVDGLLILEVGEEGEDLLHGLVDGNAGFNC